MVRKKSDYMRIMEMGEWLETFLQPDLEPWRYRELAIDAIKQLNLNSKISENDLSLRCIEKIEFLKPESKKAFMNVARSLISFDAASEILKERNDEWGILSLTKEIDLKLKDDFEEAKRNFLDVVDRQVENELKELEEKRAKGIYRFRPLSEVAGTIKGFAEGLDNTRKNDNNFQSAAKKLLMAGFQSDEFSGTIREIVIDVMIEPFKLKSALTSLFKVFSKSNIPWWERYKLEKQKKPENETREEKCFRILKNSYSDIVDSISIDNGPPAIVRSFSIAYESIFAKVGIPNIFPWKIIASRMMFDFLLYGGQDYYGFCEYCDKFFLIQRKGRKKYCSDVCRATASKVRNLPK